MSKNPADLIEETARTTKRHGFKTKSEKGKVEVTVSDNTLALVWRNAYDPNDDNDMFAVFWGRNRITETKSLPEAQKEFYDQLQIYD